MTSSDLTHSLQIRLLILVKEHEGRAWIRVQVLSKHSRIIIKVHSSCLLNGSIIVHALLTKSMQIFTKLREHLCIIHHFSWFGRRFSWLVFCRLIIGTCYPSGLLLFMIFFHALWDVQITLNNVIIPYSHTPWFAKRIFRIRVALVKVVSMSSSPSHQLTQGAISDSMLLLASKGCRRVQRFGSTSLDL